MSTEEPGGNIHEGIIMGIPMAIGLLSGGMTRGNATGNEQIKDGLAILFWTAGAMVISASIIWNLVRHNKGHYDIVDFLKGAAGHLIGYLLPYLFKISF